jgi:uroporphyrinogen III methyltransferase/synthase
MPFGRVSLIGAGPGDPGLITVKGLERIRRADVVLYDYLAEPSLLKEARPDAEIIYVGKKAGDHAMRQEDINELLVEKARGGKRVARLKGGDPYVFGRGGEEALHLAENGVPFEVVPGVSAGVAAPAYAGIPVTHRGLATSVAFVTGHESPDKEESGIDWSKIANAADTLVFFMGVRNLPDIVARLVENGRPADTPIALIQWGSRPDQKSVAGTLETIVGRVLESGLKPPALIVVGAVVGLRERLNWFESRPLFGQRILVTRSRHQASQLSAKLAELGAQAVELPTIDIAPLEDFAELDAVIGRVGAFDWLIFTSINGVDAFFERFFALRPDIRALGGAKIAAIGQPTADRLRALRLAVDFVPERFISEEFVLEFIKGHEAKGKSFLLPGSSMARDVIERGLRAEGADFTFVPVYRNIPVGDDGALARILDEGPLDWVTFTSSTTARNFFSLWKGERAFKIASIGPITSQTVREAGHEPDIEAADHTVDGLVEALLQARERQT